jgi:hypothetical protein
MTSLLAIDPGVHACGVAYFVDGKLIRAGYVKSDKKSAASASNMANEIRTWALSMSVDDCVVELPQVYDRRHSKGDPNDLIALATICGAISCQFPRVRFVLPKEWGGQVRKEIKNARAWAKLTTEEQGRVNFPSAKSLRHNVLDAVGIGIFAIGRR